MNPLTLPLGVLNGLMRGYLSTIGLNLTIGCICSFCCGYIIYEILNGNK